MASPERSFPGSVISKRQSEKKIAKAIKGTFLKVTPLVFQV